MKEIKVKKGGYKLLIFILFLENCSFIIPKIKVLKVTCLLYKNLIYHLFQKVNFLNNEKLITPKTKDIAPIT